MRHSIKTLSRLSLRFIIGILLYTIAHVVPPVWANESAPTAIDKAADTKKEEPIPPTSATPTEPVAPPEVPPGMFGLRKVYFLIKRNQVIYELENGRLDVHKLVYNGHPKGGMYTGTYHQEKKIFMLKEKELKNAKLIDGHIAFTYPIPEWLFIVDKKEYPVIITDEGEHKWEGPNLVMDPVHHDVLLGKKITYTYEPGKWDGTDLEDSFTYEWAISSLAIKEDGSPFYPEPLIKSDEPSFSYTWAKQGRYVLTLIVRRWIKKQNKTVERHLSRLHEVEDGKRLLEEYLQTQNFKTLTDRENDLTKIEAFYQGINGPIPLDNGQVILSKHIQEPDVSKNTRRVFELSKTVSDETYTWYAMEYPHKKIDWDFQKNTCGSQVIQDGEQKKVLLGTGKSVHFACAAPGSWMITAKSSTQKELFFLLWIASKEELEHLKSVRRFNDDVEKEMADLDAEKTFEVRAAYFNKEKEGLFTLNVGVGKTKGKKPEYVLLDMTNLEGRLKYTGDTLAEVVSSFERGNSHPEGYIRVQVKEPKEATATVTTASATTPPTQAAVFDRLLVSKGLSSFQLWYSRLTWVGVGLVVVGGIVSVVPPYTCPVCKPVGNYIISAGLATFATGASLDLCDALKQREISWLRVGVDVFSIAANLAGLGSSALILKALGSGATNPQAVVMTTAMGRRFFYVALTTGNAAGFMISVDAGNQLVQVLNSKLPRRAKIIKVAQTFGIWILQGTLAFISVKGLTQAKTRLNAVLGENVANGLNTQQIHLFGFLTTDSLKKVAQFSQTQFNHLLSLLQTHPEFAAELLTTTESGVLLATEFSVQENLVQWVGGTQHEMSSLLTLARQDKLELFYSLLQNWSKVLAPKDLQAALRTLPTTLWLETSEKTFQRLSQLKDFSILALTQELGKKSALTQETFIETIESVTLRQRLYGYVEPTLIKQIPVADVQIITHVSEGTLQKVSGLPLSSLSRAIQWIKNNHAAAEQFLQSKQGRQSLKIPWRFSANHMELDNLFRIPIKLGIALSGEEKLMTLTSMIYQFEAQFGQGATKQFFQALPSSLIGEMLEQLAFVPKELGNPEHFNALLKALPQGGFTSPEQLYEAWLKVWEDVYNGHAIIRHRPGLSDKILIDRILTGFLNDPPNVTVWSPTQHATRFTSYKDMLISRREVIEGLKVLYGIDINLPIPEKYLVPGKVFARELIVQHKNIVGEGFVGTGSKTNIISFGGRSRLAYTDATPVKGLTRTVITIKWNSTAKGGQGDWEIPQFFPDACNWDELSKTYTVIPDKDFYEIP